MRKLLLVTVSSLSLLAACQYGNRTAEQQPLEQVNERERMQENVPQESLQQEQGGRVLLSNKRATGIYETDRSKARMQRETSKMGYSRKQKGDANTGTSRTAYVDRNHLADIITDMSVQLPDVTDAATMVTDDEVFVSYRANTTDPKLAASQVYKTAASVVPRYYHIYVSPDQKLMTQMEGLKSGKLNNTEFVQTVEMLKQEMVKNPHINLRNKDNKDDLDNMMTR